MKFLIDSDVISAFSSPERDAYKTVTDYFSQFENPEIYLSMLTIYEVEYGIASFEGSGNKEKIRATLQLFKDTMPIINLSFTDAEIYGELKQGFKRKTGMNQKALKRHNVDIALASMAIANNCILISKDKIYPEHLQEINPQLQCDTWG